jgi:predicted O-methyltransferase YrrM
MVPDIYHNRFEVAIGDAKTLLPPLIDRLDTIDLFFHDSDHTYAHMMFEFREAMRKLAADGVIIADDIAWTSALWDFADQHDVPGYNYLGSMGVAFFSRTSTLGGSGSAGEMGECQR